MATKPRNHYVTLHIRNRFDYQGRNGGTEFSVLVCGASDDVPVRVIAFWNGTRFVQRTSTMLEEANTGWFVFGNTHRRVLPYNFPEMVCADRLIVTTNEERANKLADLGFVATCLPHGAGCAVSVDQKDFLPRELVLDMSGEIAENRVMIWLAKRVEKMCEIVRFVPIDFPPDCISNEIYDGAGFDRGYIEAQIARAKPTQSDRYIDQWQTLEASRLRNTTDEFRREFGN